MRPDTSPPPPPPPPPQKDPPSPLQESLQRDARTAQGEPHRGAARGPGEGVRRARPPCAWIRVRFPARYSAAGRRPGPGAAHEATVERTCQLLGPQARLGRL